MYKALIFDYDDTLVDTFNIRAACIQECARVNYDLEITLDEIKSLWGRPFAEFITKLFRTDAPYEVVAAKYFATTKTYPLKLISGVKEALQQLYPNYSLGIVSASNMDIINLDFDQLGLERSMFFKIQGSNETDFHKPDPRVFSPMINSLQNMNIAPKESLFVGDSLDDFQAASLAGFNFLAIPSGITTEQKLKVSGAQVIPSFSLLPKYLRCS